eukprot:1159126-Pelagomonas_calceolata.AAC.7
MASGSAMTRIYLPDGFDALASLASTTRRCTFRRSNVLAFFNTCHRGSQGHAWILSFSLASSTSATGGHRDGACLDSELQSCCLFCQVIHHLGTWQVWGECSSSISK